MTESTQIHDEMPKAYEPGKVEQKWYKFWLEKGYFAPEIDPKKRPFVIIMPPPNVTGELHVGHALTATLEDIMIRWHRMLGEPALWLPGADHAGIATQVVVERQLAAEGLDRYKVGRQEFLTFTLGKEEYGIEILKVQEIRSYEAVTTIANAWIREPGHPLVEIASRFDEVGAILTLRQRRFFSDPQMTGAPPEQRWPVPLVLKIGTADGIREERVILAGESAEVTLPGATWIFPNGGGAGFYRFALDDGAIVGVDAFYRSFLVPH